jgi:hypothetical protein
VRDRTLLIEQALSDGRLKRQKTNRTYRTVDLLGPLAEDLREWRPTSQPPAPKALVFPRADGEPWRTDDWNNWRNRRFLPAAGRAGLGRLRPYDLRHAFASLLIREQRTSARRTARRRTHDDARQLHTRLPGTPTLGTRRLGELDPAGADGVGTDQERPAQRLSDRTGAGAARDSIAIRAADAVPKVSGLLSLNRDQGPVEQPPEQGRLF